MIALFGIMQACEDSLLILIIALFGVYHQVLKAVINPEVASRRPVRMAC
jgi:hypothetical protein